MSREDRTRSLSLLDRNRNQGKADIGAELFGLGTPENVEDTKENMTEGSGGNREGEERTEETPSDKDQRKDSPYINPVRENPIPLEDETVKPEPEKQKEAPEVTASQYKEEVRQPVSTASPSQAPPLQEAPPLQPQHARPPGGRPPADIQEPVQDRPYQQTERGRPQADRAPQEYHAPREFRYQYPKLEQPEPGFKSFRHMVINVYSPKGGVGKSSISKELAMAYTTATINHTPLKVLLVDADWEFGDITTLFNVAPRPNVTDWIRDMMADKRQTGHIHLYSRQEIAARYLIQYSENFHILAGPGDPVEAELVTEEMVTAIIESLKRTDYDIIVIDSANSNRKRSLIPLMKADAVVLVETLDTSTVAETTAVLNTLRTQQFDFGKLYMVLNQVPEDVSGMDISVSEISRLLQLDIAAIIPRYEMLRVINNAGEAAVLKKSTPYSRAIYQLANRIVPLFKEEKRGPLSNLLKWVTRKR